MIAIRRFLSLFQDSPTYIRDRASLISGVNIGIIGLLLNGGVLIFVLPMLVNPDAPIYRDLAVNLEFGQLLAMALLGGATIIATLLIPLRLATVFWEPRIGRYFDQIVLSGITPLRYMIGKATSQNLYLGMILFLLFPYLVLSLTLGGVDLGFFVAGLFLLWLYCMGLALVTLWISLYLNELLAGISVIAAAGLFFILGCIPMQFQPFLMTPIPVLVHPLWASNSYLQDIVGTNYFPIFIACVACMTTFIAAALVSIYLGPLYGVIRENSTFGEVVRVGDSKRKRWIRFRPHIQRSSELAFFYENRSRAFLGYEGFLRWGIQLASLAVISAGADVLLVRYFARRIGAPSLAGPFWVSQLHGSYLCIHGIGMLIAVLLFSHAKNTTFMPLSFFRGWKVEISKLDTIAFFLFVSFSTAAAISTPILFERYVAGPRAETIFLVEASVADHLQTPTDIFNRISVQMTLTITLMGLVVYAIHRYACLEFWLRSGAFFLASMGYYVLICLLPFAMAISLQMDEFRSIPVLGKISPYLAMCSPIAISTLLVDGRMPNQFPPQISTIPFYGGHLILLCLLMWGMRRKGLALRRMYLIPANREANLV